jgi:hypothetical protein
MKAMWIYFSLLARAERASLLTRAERTADAQQQVGTRYGNGA